MTPRLAAAAAASVSLTFAAAALAAPAPSPAAPSPSPTPLSLTLAQAEDIALASSPALALARGQLAQAEAGIGQARSGALPNVSANGSTTHSSSTIPAGSFGPTQTSPIQSMNISDSGSVNLRQLLLDGGRIHDQVRSARLSSLASAYSLTREIQTVEFGVASAYYGALQARHQLATALDSLNLAQVQERLVEAQFRAGVASKADVITAQLPVAQAQLAVAQAGNGEQTQLASLLDTMGLPAQTAVAIADEPASPATVPPLADVLATAQRERPDLLAAHASKDAADAGLRAAHLGLFPTVTGTAATTTAGAKSTLVPGGGYTPGWSIGAQLSIPLFDGGLTRSLTQSAQAQDDQAAASLRSEELLVSMSVQQAYLGVQTAQAGLDAAEVEYQQARTVLDVTNAQYKAGVTTLPLLLNAQVGLSKAESDRYNAIYGYKIAWQQLLLAQGTIAAP